MLAARKLWQEIFVPTPAATARRWIDYAESCFADNSWRSAPQFQKVKRIYSSRRRLLALSEKPSPFGATFVWLDSPNNGEVMSPMIGLGVGVVEQIARG
jgi:hypothetical protein